MSTPASAYVTGVLFKESWATGVVPSLKDCGKRWVFALRKDRLSEAHCSMFASHIAECANVVARIITAAAESGYTLPLGLPMDSLARLKSSRYGLAEPAKLPAAS